MLICFSRNLQWHWHIDQPRLLAFTSTGAGDNARLPRNTKSRTPWDIAQQPSSSGTGDRPLAATSPGTLTVATNMGSEEARASKQAAAVGPGSGQPAYPWTKSIHMWPENRSPLAPFLACPPALQVAPASIHAPAAGPCGQRQGPLVGASPWWACCHGLSKQWCSPCVEQIVS